MRVEEAFVMNLNKYMKGRRMCDLEKETSLHRNIVSGWRRGDTRPTLVGLWKISRWLGVSMEDLLEGTDEPLDS